eukprot:403360637
MRWEVYPVIFLAASMLIYSQFKTQVQNLVPTKLLKFEVLTEKEEKFVARKLSGLMQQIYQSRLLLKQDNIDVALVKNLYSYLLDYCHQMGFLPMSVKLNEITIFYAEVRSHQNLRELIILPNGSLFMSEQLLNDVLSSSGIEGLTFLFLHELSHLVKKHIRHNLRENYRYGDIRRQYFHFLNQYIGFDALFMDYYTNTRFNLDQELEADLFALKVMRESGQFTEFNEEKYKRVLMMMERENVLEEQPQEKIRELKARENYLKQIDQLRTMQKSNKSIGESQNQNIQQLIESLKSKVSKLRLKYMQKEQQRKSERQTVKAQRDYEIFDQMPYKFNTKCFSLKERHPISRMRFENANKYIQNFFNQESSRAEDRQGVNSKLQRQLEQVFEVWSAKQNKEWTYHSKIN